MFLSTFLQLITIFFVIRLTLLNHLQIKLGFIPAKLTFIIEVVLFQILQVLTLMRFKTGYTIIKLIESKVVIL